MLRITVSDLSKISGVGIATIKRIEAHKGVPPANAKTLNLLFMALVSSGIEFVGESFDRPGVRLNLPPQN
jgi:hypothetical protein